MPDTPENQVDFPQPVCQKPGLGFPLARLVVLIPLATGAVLDMAVGPGQGKATGEHALLRQILGGLKFGDIPIADRYYCSYFLLAMLSLMGVDAVFQVHASRQIDLRRGLQEMAMRELLGFMRHFQCSNCFRFTNSSHVH
ncbi:MAG: hypothetical protein HQL84_02770 [Magnetococcales bacterium]|nr:hypothetical protein [Magnetococcales bacterium]MBF0631181.1 hypothetical protein [Magnetococcales bacterium]